jgi:glycosyltransferase involved in cell wall biosynthesis
VKGLKGVLKSLLNSLPWITVNASVAVSPLMRQRQLESGRLPSRKVVVVTNGVVVRELIIGAREQLVRRFGIAPECFIVCAVGRLNEYKRFDFAIRAASAAARANEGLRPVLLLVGDGPDRSRLQRIADEEVVWVRTILTGHLDDVWPILCGVDAVIHPSTGEGLSLAILEAMAAARPVVVPDVPSVSQSIRHGVTGYVYADGSLDGVAHVLGKLACSSGLRLLVGGTAREHVLQEFTIDRAVDDFRRLVVPQLFRGM